MQSTWELPQFLQTEMFLVLGRDLLSSQDVSLLCVLALGNTETEGNLKEETLRTHRSKEQLQACQFLKLFKF